MAISGGFASIDGIEVFPGEEPLVEVDIGWQATGKTSANTKRTTIDNLDNFTDTSWS